MIRTFIFGGVTLAVAAAITWVAPNDKFIGDTLLLCALFATSNFTFWYLAKSRWKLLNAGRSLAYVFLALDFVLLQNSLSVWLSTEYFGRQVIRSMMYLGIVVAVFSMTRTLWTIQHREQTVLPEQVPRYLDQFSKKSDSL